MTTELDVALRCQKTWANYNTESSIAKTAPGLALMNWLRCEIIQDIFRRQLGDINTKEEEGPHGQ